MKITDKFTSELKEQNEIIVSAYKEIERLHEDFCKIPIPTNLRPATPNDIFVGNVIWIPNDESDKQFVIIEAVMDPKYAWKGYEASDGCRYGLDFSFVEMEE